MIGRGQSDVRWDDEGWVGLSDQGGVGEGRHGPSKEVGRVELSSRKGAKRRDAIRAVGMGRLESCRLGLSGERWMCVGSSETMGRGSVRLVGLEKTRLGMARVVGRE